MPPPLTVDDKLIERARQVGKHRSRNAAVTAALEAYIRLRLRSQLVDMAGNVDYWPDYDHKKLREGKRRK